MIELLESRFLFARPLGVDTSHWDGTINWSQVKSAGYDFAWTKITEGTTYLDPTAATNLVNAKAAGVLIGAYHFARYDNNAAADEVSWYLANAGPYIKAGYLVPMLDVEHAETLTKAQLSQWVNDWCNGVLAATGVRPVIYTGVSFAANNLDSSVTQWPLWMASWPSNPNPQTGGPSGTSPWSTWNFWQYTDAASVSGISIASDADVFNGTLAQLQSTYMIGALPGAPTNPSPANNATNVNRGGLVLDWSDASNAVSYDVYLDNLNTPITNVTTSQWTISPQVSGGTHQWKVVAKNAAGSTSGATWSFGVAALPAPAAPASPNYNNVIASSKPITLDWADSANATSYDIYFSTNTSPTATITVSQYGPITPADGTRLWRVVARNADASTSGPQWQYTMDTTPPQATYNGELPATGAATFDFTLTYHDATTSVSGAGLDSNDISVSGPGGYSAAAALVSVDQPGDGATRTATYRITAPGGTWNLADAGSYTIALNGNQVSDVANNATPAGTVGAFVFTPDFAYQTGSTLHVDFDGSGPPIALSAGGGNIAATRGATTLNFSGIANIIVTGSASDDALQLANTVAPPMTFSGNGGNDTVEVQGGSASFASDLGATALVTIDAGASATFTAAQHLRGLNLAGSASLSLSGNNVLVLKSLSISGAGQLDLSDNDLVLDYSGASQIGSWNGSAYTGITGLLASGAISSSAASGSVTGLAVADAADVLDFSAAQTALFSGETVDSTAVLVKFTYVGDANLDGVINGDDYAAIDGSFPQDVHGYGHGDVNYDGVINGDDYFAIDANFTTQGLPL